MVVVGVQYQGVLTEMLMGLVKPNKVAAFRNAMFRANPLSNLCQLFNTVLFLMIAVFVSVSMKFLF